MSTRRVYTDEKGPYFKGEGFKFRHPALKRASSHVTDVSVSCGQASAGAMFSINGERRFTTSHEEA